MKYYAAIKKKEFSSFAATWMELENIMLSEISQSMKDTSHDLTHLWIIKNIKS